MINDKRQGTQRFVITILLCWAINIAALVIAFILVVAGTRFSYLGEDDFQIRICGIMAFMMPIVGSVGAWMYARSKFSDEEWKNWRPSVDSFRGILMALIVILPTLALIAFIVVSGNRVHH
jgi:F0F1-type ATP synthase membrane subunit c/vacuolar-type H+-ATPase subunit K